VLDRATVITPAEFHALNSLVEATVLHNTIYLFWPALEMDERLVQPLIDEDILIIDAGFDSLRRELELRNLWDIDIYEDLVWHTAVIGYKDPSGLANSLQALVDFDEAIGISRIIGIDEENVSAHALSGGELRVLSLGALSAYSQGFTEDDLSALATMSRHVRAYDRVGQELGLDIYTGLLYRPFLLGQWFQSRRSARYLFEKMRGELDDVDDTDIPQWSRIEIPILTQILLERCKGDVEAFGPELLALRDRHSRYRLSMSQYRSASSAAKSRGEKRKLRKEQEKSWAAMLKKEEGRTTRLLHHIVRVFSRPTPTSIIAEVADEAIDREEISAAVEKVDGLTDLWAELSSAPTIEQNIRLMHDTFGAEPSYETWLKVQELSRRLEQLMTREELPALS
jgi:hypothetical protein